MIKFGLPFLSSVLCNNPEFSLPEDSNIIDVHGHQVVAQN